jgi:hypothetical protein
MSRLRVLFVATAWMLSACTTAPLAQGDSAAAEKEIRQRVADLLQRYANNDQAGVLAMLDPERLTVFGSNLTEVVRTPQQLEALMNRDFGLWQSATFTHIRDIDTRSDGTLATTYLVFDFSAANGPTVPIRFSSTWRKVKGEWLLTQSASAVMMNQ